MGRVTSGDIAPSLSTIYRLVWDICGTRHAADARSGPLSPDRISYLGVVGSDRSRLEKCYSPHDEFVEFGISFSDGGL